MTANTGAPMRNASMGAIEKPSGKILQPKIFSQAPDQRCKLNDDSNLRDFLGTAGRAHHCKSVLWHRVNLESSHKNQICCFLY